MVLAQQLHDDDIIDKPISSSTLQRMINDYLTARACEISFTQSDHNACPNCNTLGYYLLQFSHERKILKSKRDTLATGPRPFLRTQQEIVDFSDANLAAKIYQESSSLTELKEHTSRDPIILKFLKRLTDHFPTVERSTKKWDIPHRFRGDSATTMQF